MKRYQVVYLKIKNGGYPMTAWFDTFSDARDFVLRFRSAGYSCDVWEQTEKGARIVVIT